MIVEVLLLQRAAWYNKCASGELCNQQANVGHLNDGHNELPRTITEPFSENIAASSGQRYNGSAMSTPGLSPLVRIMRPDQGKGTVEAQ